MLCRVGSSAENAADVCGPVLQQDYGVFLSFCAAAVDDLRYTSAYFFWLRQCMIFRSLQKVTRMSVGALSLSPQFMFRCLQDMARGISKHSWNIHVKAQAHEAGHLNGITAFHIQKSTQVERMLRMPPGAFFGIPGEPGQAIL